MPIHENKTEDKKVFTYVSTSSMDDPPRNSTSLPRSPSFCLFSEEGSTPISANATHVFSKVLGKGSYGTVTLMTPTSASHNPIAVKKFSPELTYSASTSDDEITNKIQSNLELIKKEIPFHAIYSGINGSFCTSDPITIKLDNYNQKKVTNYPHVYIATEFIDGTVFAKYQINSSLTYLRVCIATLQSLQQLHNKFMHLDIHSHNLFICEDKEMNITVRFCDFSLSKISEDDILDVSCLNLAIKPPEYKGNVKVKPHRNQDVYCTGRIFKEKYSADLFKSNLTSSIERIFTDMMNITPGLRLTVDETIFRFANILGEALSQSEVVNHFNLLSSATKKQLFILLFETKRRELEKKFPEKEAIDQWLYCERFLCDINKPEPEINSYCLAGYAKVINKNTSWVNYLGATRFKERLSDGRATLSTSLMHVAPENRYELLKHLQIPFIDEYAVWNLLPAEQRINYIIDKLYCPTKDTLINLANILTAESYNITILEGLYKKSFYIEPEIEHTIWNNLINTDPHIGAHIFSKLLNAANSEKKLQFFVFWIKSVKTEHDVLQAYNSISNVVSDTQKTIIKSIIKDRILAIKLAANTSGLSASESKLDDEDQKQVNKLFKPSRLKFFCCASSNHYSDVYKMLRKNTTDATEIYQKRQKEKEDNINKKLTKELGQQTHFKLL